MNLNESPSLHDIDLAFCSQNWLSDRALHTLFAINDENPHSLRGRINPATIDLITAQTTLLGRDHNQPLCCNPLPLVEGITALFPIARSRLLRNGYVPTCNPNGNVREIQTEGFGFYFPGTARFQRKLAQGESFMQTYVAAEREDISFAQKFRPLISQREVESLFSTHLELTLDGKPADYHLTPGGLLVLHAAEYLLTPCCDQEDMLGSRALGKHVDYDKKDITGTGIIVRPGSAITIPTREKLKLSDHICMQLFPAHTHAPVSGGHIDPGFEGSVGEQPLLFWDERITAGNPCLYARLCFVEEPVQAPYSNASGHTFQGHTY